MQSAYVFGFFNRQIIGARENVHTYSAGVIEMLQAVLVGLKGTLGQCQITAAFVELWFIEFTNDGDIIPVLRALRKCIAVFEGVTRVLQ